MKIHLDAAALGEHQRTAGTFEDGPLKLVCFVSTEQKKKLGMPALGKTLLTSRHCE